MYRLHESKIPMLSEAEVKAVSLLKKKLKESFSLRKLILFGSKARADFGPHSDVDLMVLVDEPRNYQMREKLSNIEHDVITVVYDAPLMCMLDNYDEWEKVSWLPLKEEVEKDGIEIELD